MGNTKSLEANGDSTDFDDKSLSQAVSDNALNKKSSGSMTADLKKKKYAESNRSMSSIDNKKPQMLNSNQKIILKYCINNSKEDLGERIFRRVADKNPVFQDYFESLPKPERAELSDGLRQFIIKMVEQACETENLESVCRNFGEQYARLDFKPDFVLIANSLTTECVFLDAAAHPYAETLATWSQLTSIVFGFVRDGYYSELRRLRRVSATGSAKESEEQQPKEEVTAEDDQVFTRSADASPTDNSMNQLNRVRSEPAQFLAPPSAY
ncbi:hypothetical protein M3Y97_00820500 [Aphelenchoides bicaudatus]|nr:hypothetical protein M3Y97_00820500 [Aphelenchoides bicaudatus]